MNILNEEALLPQRFNTDLDLSGILLIGRCMDLLYLRMATQLGIPKVGGGNTGMD